MTAVPAGPLLGCDFSSAPSVRKPIVVAVGRLRGDDVHLDRLETFATLDAWQHWLAAHPQQARLACRFDVVSYDGPVNAIRQEWLRGAFEVD